MDYKKWLLLLLGLILLFIFIDIATGIFFWNRLNLVFSCSYFDPSYLNDVISPFTTVISLFVLYKSLDISSKQNELMQTQHYRAYFEKEFDKILRKAENQKIDLKYIDFVKGSYNRVTYIDLIYELLINISTNNEYLSDLKNHKDGQKLDLDYIKNRSYYGIFLYLSDFTLALSNRSIYDELKALLNEINKSKLLEADKLQLKRTIKKEILFKYLNFISFEDSWPDLSIPIPILSKQHQIEFTLLSKTSFREHYDWFVANI